MRGPISGGRIVALAGLIVACCVAAIVFTVDKVSHQAALLQRGRREAGNGRSSIVSLDGSVFDSPQDIYTQALRKFDRYSKSDTSGDALAWEHPHWKRAVTGIVGGVQHASDLEAKIAKDVSSQLSGDISTVASRNITFPSPPVQALPPPLPRRRSVQLKHRSGSGCCAGGAGGTEGGAEAQEAAAACGAAEREADEAGAPGAAEDHAGS